MQAELKELSKDEKSLLLFLETRAVDYGGRVDTRMMSKEDIQIAERWNEEDFVQFGRIVMRHHNSQGTHWCKLSEEAFQLAYAERRERQARMWEKRTWLSTKENTEEHGIVAVRLGLIEGQTGEQPKIEASEKATRGAS